MTEQFLRNAVKEAQEKNQLCLLIWANWSVWDDLSSEVTPGSEYYNFALSQISNGEEATFSTEWQGLSMPGVIAISVQKLSSSNEFFSHVLSVCEKGNYQGPITLLPLNRLVDFC